MPTLTEPLFLQCGHATKVLPLRDGESVVGFGRCMVPLNQHDGLDHEYVSLGVPCLFCRAAITWRAGRWQDSLGARCDGHGLTHEPDPSYVA